MTMEMWALGFAMHPLRLALFLALMFPLLVVLAYYAGFEASISWRQLVLSACVAYAVAFVAAGVGLALLGVLRLGMPLEEIVGKIALQAIPASIGAMLARSQLGQRDEEQEEEERRDTYFGELFLATVGALFLAFNVAPTEEIVLIVSHDDRLARARRGRESRSPSCTLSSTRWSFAGRPPGTRRSACGASSCASPWSRTRWCSWSACTCSGASAAVTGSRSASC